MQFPKPIGYYSIDLPESVQQQVQDLDRDDLKHVLLDVACKIDEPDMYFYCNTLGCVISDAIEDQFTCTNDWLGFMSWVLEGLKQAHN